MQLLVSPWNYGGAESAEKLPAGYLPYEQFVKKFSLGGVTTEQVHAGTKTVSQTLQANAAMGMRTLFGADQEVLRGFERFIPTAEKTSTLLKEKMSEGGRVFLVGSGSSGRVAVDLAV